MLIADAAFEYEQNYGATTLQPFFDSSIPQLRHPEVQGWGQDLLQQREHLKQHTSLPIKEAIQDKST